MVWFVSDIGGNVWDDGCVIAAGVFSLIAALVLGGGMYWLTSDLFATVLAGVYVPLMVGSKAWLDWDRRLGKEEVAV